MCSGRAAPAPAFPAPALAPGGCAVAPCPGRDARRPIPPFRRRPPGDRPHAALRRPYDGADRPLSPYTTDADGDLTGDPSGGTYSYDQAGRLAGAAAGGTQASYTYDGDGRRMGKAVTAGGSTTTTSFVYDPNAALDRVLDDGAREYVWGAGLEYSVDTAGTVAVYQADGLGSIRALTDMGGNTTAAYRTDGFGVPAAGQASSGQPFRYDGEQLDAETGYVFMRAQNYLWATGSTPRGS